MHISTTVRRWTMLVLTAVCLVGSAHAQRKVTLQLNTATIPDTTNVTSLIKVMGAVDPENDGSFTDPITLPSGERISWSTSGANESQLNVTNIGGDYWQIEFEVPDTATTTFKFFSQQAQDNGGLDGWEADPNPTIGPSAGDTTLGIHFFESNNLYKGVSGNRGDYNWRPYTPKEDSVAVLFRVYMKTPEGNNDGYDGASTTKQIKVQGEKLSGVGPLDWSSTTLTLEKESTESGKPGFDLYSAWGFYPDSLAGKVQNYKFTIQDGTSTAYEEGNLAGNRSFRVPAQDSTLHWVYYGNTVPTVEEPVTASVLFSVDLTPLEEIGIYSRARGDTLQVRGGFNGWDCGVAEEDCRLDIIPGEQIYEGDFLLTQIPGTEQGYKYYLDFNDVTFQDQFGQAPPSGWEEPFTTTGANRTFIFSGESGQDVGLQFYNDILPGNVMPEGEETALTFRVDMSDVNNPAEPFVPGEDSVFVAFHDAIWQFTQREQLDDLANEGVDTSFVLTDPDGDGVYEGTLTVVGPTYAGLLYRFAYGGQTSQVIEAGGSTSGLGRRRQRFIPLGEGGATPAAYSFPVETFQLTGNLPFEPNPAVGTSNEPGDKGSKGLALGQNQPNPFRGNTQFTYTVDAPQRVSVRVYDAIGRLVATLVDGTVQPGTHTVSFHAANLASGVYVYRVETANGTATKRMVVVR